ncbi:hypothetical protein [Candidatus Methylacidithermus pantelleriae]|uniref:Resolvase/invertase-type recombinase catalytic domain-containing protein n=1 Tax=Candidatus Methylacidithermus pantelleriae TaxID=2744239 RepID=A0A8J2BPD8_9BACT|nr:hypothetical protein [Candidatus Methylacidithermus pantelleriae]CAF0703940.1 hypothetical protein MPNT_60144 [Candidatus Methylacidithermus pantelleriae]
MNGDSRGLVGQVSDPKVGVILVEECDRLMRLRSDYREATLAAESQSILLVDPNGMSDDIVRALDEVMVSLCARLYGKRSPRNCAKKAVEPIA